MKKNETKRNTSKRSLLLVALLLLVAVFTFGGYTLSKYISTQTSGEQSATVAKWGYTVTADASGLFGEKYDNTGSVTAGSDNISVSASGKTLAPGTKGSMTFGISGTAEVLANINFKLTGNDVELKLEDGTSYLPVEYTLKWSDKEISSRKLSDIEKYVQNILENPEITVDGLKSVESKTNVYKEPGNEELALSFTLEWNWAFTNNKGATGTSAEIGYDVLDTILGLYANNSGSTSVSYNGKTYNVTGSNHVLNLNMTFSVTQVQSKA